MVMRVIVGALCTPSFINIKINEESQLPRLTFFIEVLMKCVIHIKKKEKLFVDISADTK